MNLLTLRITILALLGILVTPAFSQIDSVVLKQFIQDFNDPNISRAELKLILSNATFQPTIIEKISKPAEGTMTWDSYRSIFVREDRIEAGIKFWNENAATIAAVSETTGVDASVLVGIIGVETFYGQRPGTYVVLDALYTLAFGYPKRSSYFKAELAEYLRISRQEELDVLTTKGSYAGAMGYCQFMPSSYTAYAVSFDEGGKRDLVNEVEDAIASVANYLQMHRWKRGEPIATSATLTSKAVLLPEQKIKPAYQLAYYLNQGYEPEEKLDTNQMISLLSFDLKDGTKEYWFTTDNFYAITRYNHSPMYALAVFQLGEEIRKRREKL